MQVAETSDGFPFGKTDESDIAHLMDYAKAKGVDLDGSLELAYKNDDAALARAFSFSLKFTKLDDDARTYGQIIWSSFLNLAEARGPDWYARLIAKQPKEVRQRIRDIIYYPINLAPAGQRAEGDKDLRKQYPLLFPSDYLCGIGDTVFVKQANQSSEPTSASVTPPAGQESRPR